jgi:hypothetical protein
LHRCRAILSAGSVAGRFANAIGRVNFNGGSFEVIYSSTGVTLTNFQVPVPEPPAALILLPAAGWYLRRHRAGPSRAGRAAK